MIFDKEFIVTKIRKGYVLPICEICNKIISADDLKSLQFECMQRKKLHEKVFFHTECYKNIKKVGDKNERIN